MFGECGLHNCLRPRRGPSEFGGEVRNGVFCRLFGGVLVGFEMDDESLDRLIDLVSLAEFGLSDNAVSGGEDSGCGKDDSEKSCDHSGNA